MSLLPLATFSAAGVPLYGSGGGGGGGSNQTISTIVAPAGGILGISGELYIFSKGFGNSNTGFEVYNGGGNTTNALADFDAGAGGQGAIGVRGYSTISGSQTIDSLLTVTLDAARNGVMKLQHEFNGVSTLGSVVLNNDGTASINALPAASGGAGTQIVLSPTASTITFGPQQAIACHSKIPISTNTYVPQAGTTQAMGNFTSIAGHVYDIRLPVRVDAVTAPAAGDWCVITTDTATAPVALATFDLVQVSSVANQYETHLCGTVIASGATTTLLAEGKLSAGTSTAITVTGSSAWVRDLGIPVAP